MSATKHSLFSSVLHFLCHSDDNFKNASPKVYCRKELVKQFAWIFSSDRIEQSIQSEDELKKINLMIRGVVLL